jgi:hypothetical protein
MHSLGQVCVGFAEQRDHPNKAVVRTGRACRSDHIPTAAAWLRTNVAPRRPPKPHYRHQALPGPGAAQDRPRQTKASREQTSHRLAHSPGALLSRPDDAARQAWLGLGAITPGACTKALRNRRYVAAGGFRCPRSNRNAGAGLGGSQGAAFLEVWLIGRFTIPIPAGVYGRARWYSDRSRR